LHTRAQTHRGKKSFDYGNVTFDTIRRVQFRSAKATWMLERARSRDAAATKLAAKQRKIWRYAARVREYVSDTLVPLSNLFFRKEMRRKKRNAWKTLCRCRCPSESTLAIVRVYSRDVPRRCAKVNHTIATRRH
jgi:hypothetical protein